MSRKPKQKKPIQRRLKKAVKSEQGNWGCTRCTKFVGGSQGSMWQHLQKVHAEKMKQGVNWDYVDEPPRNEYPRKKRARKTKVVTTSEGETVKVPICIRWENTPEAQALYRQDPDAYLVELERRYPHRDIELVEYAMEEYYGIEAGNCPTKGWVKSA